MRSNAGCWKPLLAALAIVTSLLSACVTVSSDRVVGECPPVVEYEAAFQARAAEEVFTLPERSTVLKMIRDYSVIREQVRRCSQIDPVSQADEHTFRSIATSGA